HPRLGVWRFAFDNESDGLPRCMGDLTSASDVTRVRLESLETGSPPRALREGYLGIIRSSYARHADAVLFEAARWPAYACADKSANARAHAGTTEQAAPREPMSPWRTAWTLATHGVDRWLRYLFVSESWNIGIVDRPIASFLSSTDVSSARWYPKREARRFMADPFGVVDDHGQHVFFESLYPGKHGEIWHETCEDYEWKGAPSRVLMLPVHLSYPFMVADGARALCAPSTAAAMESALYEARAFPGDWRKVATLIAGEGGIDNTIVRWQGRYWLFCGHRGDGPHYKLFAYSADRIEGPWRPHAANPVKIDARAARGAGTPFEAGDALYRPSQDCAATYGGRVTINKIRTLTESAFEEEAVAVVAPARDGVYREGVHTLSRFGDATLIDGKHSLISGAGLWYLLTRPLAWLVRAMRGGRG
ncbi:MAG TPA: hypothetical protein VEJ20_09215, partial [Candidatus Eremiobacteraceae bacterium]|nr:hypothetical protein [Candidatus Eremiobacteraceae bacterium]